MAKEHRSTVASPAVRRELTAAVRRPDGRDRVLRRLPRAMGGRVVVADSQGPDSRQHPCGAELDRPADRRPDGDRQNGSRRARIAELTGRALRPCRALDRAAVAGQDPALPGCRDYVQSITSSSSLG